MAHRAFKPIGTCVARATVVTCALLALSTHAWAQPAEVFYRGRSITMLVASGVGGGYDTYARAFARHALKHLPGVAAIIAKNMPAASGLAAANALYNSSDREGGTIAALTNGVAMEPLFGNPGARYDALRLNWLGSIGKLENVCATWFSSPAKSIEAVREREVTVAAAGTTSNTAIVPRALNALIGTKFKLVAGYDTGSGLTMALERGETEGICGLSWSTMKASRPHWIRDHKLNVIVQMGLQKLPDLPEVPSALDLLSDPESRQLLELILIRQEAGRPFAAPPGVPGDRLAALRHAFDATVRDPDFLAEARKLQMEVDPLSAVEIDALLASAYRTPKEIVRRAAVLVEPSAAAR